MAPGGYPRPQCLVVPCSGSLGMSMTLVHSMGWGPMFQTSLFWSVTYSLMQRSGGVFIAKRFFVVLYSDLKSKPLTAIQNYQLGRQTQSSLPEVEKNRNLLSLLHRPSSTADSLGTKTLLLPHFPKKHKKLMRWEWCWLLPDFPRPHWVGSAWPGVPLGTRSCQSISQ